MLKYFLRNCKQYLRRIRRIWSIQSSVCKVESSARPVWFAEQNVTMISLSIKFLVIIDHWINCYQRTVCNEQSLQQHFIFVCLSFNNLHRKRLKFSTTRLLTNASRPSFINDKRSALTDVVGFWRYTEKIQNTCASKCTFNSRLSWISIPRYL